MQGERASQGMASIPSFKDRTAIRTVRLHDILYLERSLEPRADGLRKILIIYGVDVYKVKPWFPVDHGYKDYDWLRL